MNCKCEQCDYVFLDDRGKLACSNYHLCVDNELFECEAEEKEMVEYPSHFDKAKTSGKEAIYNSLIQKEEGKDKMTVDQSIYRKNIIDKIDRQIQKGIDKYGTTLEQNNWLKTIDRIVYLQEELIDALVYSEHIIAKLKELNIDLD